MDHAHIVTTAAKRPSETGMWKANGHSSLASRAAAAVALLYSLGLDQAYADRDCRYLPDDAQWPNATEWEQLNATVNGRLLETVPLARVCHSQPYADYDTTECAALQSLWTEAETYEARPAEVMNPYFQNQSCDPFTNTSEPCELGNAASYSINITGRDDVLAGIKFAKEKNVRLVIKNTGHDYNGKSVGKGALSLWTFNLKTIDFMENYTSATYSGPAVKLGPGVIAGEAYQAISQAGYRVVGGECASIGLAGGYTQGGGHSMLNSAYGMAADNVLEWEVVTAAGEYLVATPDQNTDLYWALSGGGGGTYGAVLSMTMKMFPEGPVASGSLTFTLGGSPNETSFWESVELWFQQLPFLTGDNNTVLFELENETLSAFAITLPDQSPSALSALLAPYLAELDRLNVNYTLTSSSYPTYLDYFRSILGPLPYGSIAPTEIWISRLIPRTLALNATATAALVDVYRDAVRDGTFFVGCNVVDVANASSHPDNAVLPAWRDAIALCNVAGAWDYAASLEQNYAIKERLAGAIQPAVEARTPGSGVYLNEVDPSYQGNWKTEMYGVNYDRLLDIKHTYDPDYLFYGHFAVGSDEFSIDEEGRLCRP